MVSQFHHSRLGLEFDVRSERRIKLDHSLYPRICLTVSQTGPRWPRCCSGRSYPGPRVASVGHQCLVERSLRTVADGTTAEHTITIGQRGDVFPERDALSEIQHIPQNGITLGTRRIRQGGFPPFPNESEDENTKQQRIEGKDVNHNDKGGKQSCRMGSYLI